ncbi:MAG TPA: right-handed parallel beta-helix repeat-containing protein [Polyangiaceae bacterium]|nr:right-handed parallel beta-helix repeat-containing protein [Polyangiaceae bacterium]
MRIIFVSLSSLLIAACSSPTESNDATGGTTGTTGGVNASGGAATGGANTATGGSSITPSTGGLTSTGGSVASGGSATPQGGSSTGQGGSSTGAAGQQSGGTSSGGSAVGGSKASGGVSAGGSHTGGSTAAGASGQGSGGTAKGGTSSTGGASSTGGTSSTGGAPSTTGARFVSPTGDDANDGSMAKPYYSLSKAVSAAPAGTVIYMRGGTFKYSATIALATSGTEAAPIQILAYGDEKPVLDFSTQPYGADNRGLLLTGDYWRIIGLEISHAGDNGLKVEGSHNRIERCVFHHNGDSGIQLGFGHETVNPNGTLCSYNEVINCDSYLNFDFDSKGGDADGFACKMHNGKGNVFRGCRSYHNADDGWDLYETDWPVEITNCWAFHNGDQTDFDAIYLEKMGKKMSSYSGNGNGFKLGGNGTGGNSVGTHVVKNCVSFDHNFRSKKGFDQNSHKGGVRIVNSVAWGNGYNFMFEDDPDSGAKNEFLNNVSLLAKTSLGMEFSGAAVLTNNSWQLPVTVDASDFADMAEAAATAPRQADGSLPNNGFARLVPNSDLIDKGVDVGLPFTGSAPDLGAFER